ncbi:MAG: methyltransferase domain-containing protein [Planctomycetota bacterium]|nr:methyltransferase domain-containing protein [Planctomycetota bacterium]
MRRASPDAPVFRTHREWTLRRCPRCAAVFLENPATSDELGGDMRWSDTYTRERTRRDTRPLGMRRLRAGLRTFQQAVRRNKLAALVRAFLPRGGILIDVGCGRGNQLAMLPASIVPIGVEIDPEGADQAEAAFAPRGGRVIRADALTALGALERSSLDGAVLMSYLEHEAQPMATLRLLRRALRPGAPVFIKVPNHACVNRQVMNGRWSGYRYLDHVVCYTPRTLRRTLDRAGFDVRRFGITDRMPTSDNVWLVAASRAEATPTCAS